MISRLASRHFRIFYFVYCAFFQCFCAVVDQTSRYRGMDLVPLFSNFGGRNRRIDGLIYVDGRNRRNRQCCENSWIVPQAECQQVLYTTDHYGRSSNTSARKN
ncbi:hypothetical protein RND81_02G174500 [Saponaria officinalis]|uniref:Secreted protein n=1 Tax=Saponaria officinalis TaxID=3572 RepID=A0AAW1MR01_SAPOF